MTSLLEASGVGIPGRLQPSSLRAGAGELIAVVGPNGSGKTSLLRSLARVEDSQGQVLVDGENIAGVAEARRRRLLSFMPASHEIV